MAARVLLSDGLLFVLAHRELTLADAHHVIARIGEVNRERRPYMIVTEVRGLAVPAAKVRQAVAAARSDAWVARRQGNVVAVLLDNLLVRGALTSLSWFLPKTDMQPFASAEAALPFFDRASQSHRIPLSRRDRALLAELDERRLAKVSPLELGRRAPSVLARSQEPTTMRG